MKYKFTSREPGSLMHKLTKPVLFMAAAALMAIGIAAPAPAHAIQTYLKVCNSSASVARIKSTDQYALHEAFIGEDSCSYEYNLYDNIRIDVDPDDGSGTKDVDSYKIGVIGEGYGPCHKDSENDNSNPPNDALDGVRYRTYSTSDCS